MTSLRICDYCAREEETYKKISETLDKEGIGSGEKSAWEKVGKRHKRYQEELKKFEKPCIILETDTEEIHICEEHYKELGKQFDESH
jgi:hypothetical protein